ncbi:MAG: 50S ribosomal protein L25 [Dehalococcoidia bacterium]
MVQKTEVEVTAREVLGKKVKTLRRRGITPANIYGNKIESRSIEIRSDDLAKILKEAGRNEIVFLSLDGEERPTFVHEVQRNPVTDAILHVDFLQIDLTKKVKIDVTVHLVGVAPAVDTHQGILVQALGHVTVEALPSAVPSLIEVDVAVLEEIDQALHVSDLRVPEGVEIVTDPDQMIAKVEPPVVEVVEEVEVEEGLEEGEEAEEPAEGAAEAAEGEGEAEE